MYEFKFQSRETGSIRITRHRCRDFMTAMRWAEVNRAPAEIILEVKAV